MAEKKLKVCLVGSSGGHLTHLYMLKPFWQDKDRFWVTFDKEDARSLLKGEKMYSVYYPSNRSIKAQIINLLDDLRKETGAAILFIAHDLSIVKYFSNRIAVMCGGKIVELAPADELFKNPLHPYTKSLLSAIPYPDPHSEKNKKRIVYKKNEMENFNVEKLALREVAGGHFVLCEKDRL